MLGSIIKQERINQEMKQDVLCFGICSVSYLSKIENEQAEPSEEIIALLFSKLGISYHIDIDDNDFETLTKSIETYLLYDFEREELTKEYLERLDRFRYSRKYWDVFLNQVALKVFAYMPFELPESLPSKIESHPYIALYYSHKYITYDVVHTAIEKLKTARGNDTTGLIELKLSESYFFAGDFQKTIEHAKNALTIAAQFGNVRMMLWAHFRLSNAYVYSDFDGALQHFEASWRLNEVIQDKELEKTINYNLGSDYLDHFFNTEDDSNLHLAKQYMQKAYGTEIFPWAEGYEKAILIHLYLDEYQEAQILFKNFSKETELLKTTVFKSLEYAINHPHFYKDKEYTHLIEQIYDESKKSQIHSRSIFVRNMLMFLYRKQRRYKKALEIMKFPV